MAAYGWNNSFVSPYSFTDPFGSGYIWQFHIDAAPPPPAPPGYGWVDIGAVAAPLPAAAPWANMQPWNPYFAGGQNRGPANINNGGIPGVVYKNAHGGVGLE